MPSFRDDFSSIEEYYESIKKSRKALWDNLDEEGRALYFKKPVELSFRDRKKIEHESFLEENKYYNFVDVEKKIKEILNAKV